MLTNREKWLIPSKTQPHQSTSNHRASSSNIQVTSKVFPPNYQLWTKVTLPYHQGVPVKNKKMDKSTEVRLLPKLLHTTPFPVTEERLLTDRELSFRVNYNLKQVFAPPY